MGYYIDLVDNDPEMNEEAFLNKLRKAGAVHFSFKNSWSGLAYSTSGFEPSLLLAGSFPSSIPEENIPWRSPDGRPVILLDLLHGKRGSWEMFGSHGLRMNVSS